MTLPRQCERQIGFRPTLMYNAVSIPVAVICPHNAVDGSPFCADHQEPIPTSQWRMF